MAKKEGGNYKKFAVAILFTFIFLVLAAFSYKFAASPAVIRNPKLAHHHFRMQIIVNGESEDFGQQKYQVAYDKDQCTVALTEQPIHFHDNKDQFVHIHWAKITGGQVFKYYGWDLVGGPPDSLGYRFENFPKLKRVPTHGKLLPDILSGSKVFVYVGDEDNFKQRRLSDWLSQDLEEFFGKKSNFPAADETSINDNLLDKLFTKAYAHGGIDDGHEEDQALEELNNLIGNVVIFVQKSPPSDQQVKERFDSLTPLPESTCAG